MIKWLRGDKIVKENQNVAINYLLLSKLFFIGLLITQFFIISTIIEKRVFENEKYLEMLVYGMILLGTFIKLFLGKIYILFINNRFDLFAILFLGVFFGYSFNEISFNLFSKINALSDLKLVALLSIPVMLFVLFELRKNRYYDNKDAMKSAFISDREVQKIADDKFEMADEANRFAERVYNFGASDSLVFGIDAPWGTGKTTFVNLCKTYWWKNHEKKMIVYSFNPLQYKNKENLLERFMEGLIREINKKTFAPELEFLISRYARFIKESKFSFSFFGLGLGLPQSSESIEDAFSQLEGFLADFDKKIIVIIDDLDRLDFATIKEVLCMAKKAFMLPNLSYILCYDTENIIALDKMNSDPDKIIEFLEKFINVKMNLYLDNKLLVQNFTERPEAYFPEKERESSQFVKNAIIGLKEIFGSNEFHAYLPFVSDSRKIKMLVNTIILLGIDKTDFENCDINNEDLIHLLLIYINYPSAFRKIYNSETSGRKGFFSVIINSKQAEKGMKYVHSEQYEKYLASVNDNQKFLLNKIFNREDIVGKSDQDILSEKRDSYACFNKSTPPREEGNLERYLKLITKMVYPEKTKQNAFYNKIKTDFSQGKSLNDIFNGTDFLHNESVIFNFWENLKHTSWSNFKPIKWREISTYVLENIDKYSLVSGNNMVDLRNYLPNYLVEYLTKEINCSKNCWEDVEAWILGKDIHEGKGILMTLGKREILGLHDLLKFRWCCYLQGEPDLIHTLANYKKLASGEKQQKEDIQKIAIQEMREISQVVFQIFKSEFLDKRKNFFVEVDKLHNKDFISTYFAQENDSEILNEVILKVKANMKNFIVRQLGNSSSSQGIGSGCGYYDMEGNEDKKGINLEFNKYLFEICFNPEKNENNYANFLDCLLWDSFQNNEGKPELSLDDITAYLSKEKLLDYWEEYGERIKSKNFEARKCFTRNYTLVDFDCLYDIFAKLDEFCEVENDSIN